MKELSETDFMNATDIADHLARKLNLPFRECYHLTAKSVKLSAPELKITNEALRKTLEEIGQPAEIADDMNTDQIIAFGGESIYWEAFPYADKIYITEVPCSPVGDTYFPQYNKTEWSETERQFVPASNAAEAEYSFVRLDRVFK